MVEGFGGVPIEKFFQERLGHSTIAITLDTYSHVLPGLQEAAALGFDTAMQTHRAMKGETAAD